MQTTPLIPATGLLARWRAVAFGAALLASTAAAAQANTAPVQLDTAFVQLDLVSGVVVAQRAGGRLQLLAARSAVRSGDILSTEDGSYARVVLPGGRTATLGPGTRVVVASATRLELVTGALQLRGAPGATGPLVLVVADSTIDAAQGSVTVEYVPEPAGGAAQAQRAYARAALASATPQSLADAGSPAGAVWEVAQLLPPVARPAGTLQPGLHVFVIDGMIKLNHTSGSLNFTTGQFGFVGTNNAPPLLIPNNPGLNFTPPAMFAQTSQNSRNNSPPKGVTVDCEVR